MNKYKKITIRNQEMTIIPSSIINMENASCCDDPCFWRDEKEKNKYFDMARNIKVVIDLLDECEDICAIKERKFLFDTVNCYFSPDRSGSEGAIHVDIWDDGKYHYSGDGRHRIIAAVEQNCDIPVLVNDLRIKSDFNQDANKKNNKEIFITQENWFCVLAYLITIIEMICRITECGSKNNDLKESIIYFFAIVIWLIIVKNPKLMNRKIVVYLNEFNGVAPTTTIVSGLLFYCMAYCNCKTLLRIIPVLSLLAVFICMNYKRKGNKFKK